MRKSNRRGERQPSSLDDALFADSVLRAKLNTFTPREERCRDRLYVRDRDRDRERNCYTKCIQTSDLIAFAPKCRARFSFFSFPIIQIPYAKIRHFSIRIHSHATMATPAVSNICANFEEVGQVRELSARVSIQFFPLSPSVSVFLFPVILSPTQHAFLFSFSPFPGLQHYYQHPTATARNSVLSTTKPTPC